MVPMMWDKILGNDSAVALLLDVDGTLIELADTPQTVSVPPELPEVLDELAARLDGALALVSGRRIEELDRLFTPYRFCAAGMHGCEIRDPSGRTYRVPLDTDIVNAMYEECCAFAKDHVGLMIEHKTFGVAIHYRLAPDMEEAVQGLATALVARFGSDFIVQPGKCVYEIKPALHSKGTAIQTLTATAPFRGRRPIFVGDDIADEEGFRVVNSLDGLSIKVGKAGNQARTHAQRSVDSPADVHRMLARLLVGLGTQSKSLRMAP